MAEFTLEQLLAEKQRRQSLKAQGQPQSEVQSILSRYMTPTTSPQGPVTTAAVGFGRALQGKDTASPQSDLQKILQTEMIKKQFEDPTVRQLREAEIASLSQPPPKGLIRVGKQLIPDPDYVKPKDQFEMDNTIAQKNAETESLKASAQDNLATIQKVKEGADFFGPLGGLPTIAAPSTYIPGGGTYATRKEWENNVNKLLSQKVIDIISEMKRVSKTGATGFGQLSEKEGAILQQASTALSRDLPKEQALFYLNEMEKIHMKVLGGENTALQPSDSVSQIPAEAQSMVPGNDLASIESELAEINKALGQ